MTQKFHSTSDHGTFLSSQRKSLTMAVLEHKAKNYSLVLGCQRSAHGHNGSAEFILLLQSNLAPPLHTLPSSLWCDEGSCFFFSFEKDIALKEGIGRMTLTSSFDSMCFSRVRWGAEQLNRKENDWKETWKRREGRRERGGQAFQLAGCTVLRFFLCTHMLGTIWWILFKLLNL